MHRFWPKSFFALVLLAMTLVSLPLIGVLVASDFMMDRLVRDSSESVYRSVSASQLSQALQEQITNQERRYRQYQVLGDANLHDELMLATRQIYISVTSLQELPQTGKAKDLLARLAAIQKRIASVLQPADNAPAGLVSDEDFKQISELGHQIYQLSLNGVYEEIKTLHEEEECAERFLLILASTCLPLTIFLGLFLTRLIARPIKQIDHGIHLLGQGEFDRDIVVSGPEDMVFLGQRLNWLREKLKGYEQEKNRFASHISHELKTPLASIHEAAELLSDGLVGPVTGEQREVISILSKNCHQLKKLIENLVGITMAQAARNCLNRTDFALSALVDEALAPHRPALVNNSLQLQTAIAPITLHADWDRLKTVLDNLLSNAIKYTPAGGSIAIRAQKSEARAIIEIHDSGPGVAAGEREHIFSPFFQGSAVCRSHVKGTGLGLAIAQEYVAAHNGQLELARLDEPGACFRITLPLTE